MNLATKPSKGVQFEQPPGEVLLRIAGLLQYLPEQHLRKRTVRGHLDDDSYAGGDFKSLTAACDRVRELVHNNALSVARLIVSKELELASLLYSPQGSYIDDWLPELASKRRAVEDLLTYAKWPGSQ